MWVCVSVCVSTSQFDLPNPSSEHNAITALEKRPVSVCISLSKFLLCCLSITTSTPSCSKFYLKQRCHKTIIEIRLTVRSLFRQQDMTQSVCLLVPKGDPDVRGMGTRNAPRCPSTDVSPCPPSVHTDTSEAFIHLSLCFKETVM